MKDVVFLIIVTPTGKHNLRQRMPAKDGQEAYELDRGLFDTHAKALEGMDRIVKPQTSYFNKDGEPLHNVPPTARKD
jgi:hypothetical protein